MPSQANLVHLQGLLLDAEELSKAHTRLRTGSRGRQWGLGAINRAAVVLCVSAWEAYVEALLRESIELMRPAPGPSGAWGPLNEFVGREIRRFNTPNVENTIKLFDVCLGLRDITLNWKWRNCSRDKARKYLDWTLNERHRIAHGANPRPTIHNYYSANLPSFFRLLAQRSDLSIRDHIATMGYVAPAW
jgi:hypothetical protein